LIDIGVLTPGPGGAPESQVRAISPNGEFAVGYSTGANAAGNTAIQQPVVWVAKTGALIQLPNPWDLNAQMTGVVILPTGGSSAEAPYDGSPAVGMSGNLNNTAYMYKALQSDLAGGTLTRTCCLGAIGLYNTSGRQMNAADERWYTGARREGTNRAQIHRRDPNGTANSWQTGVSMINSVGGTGYNAMVGWDSGNTGGAHRALWLDRVNLSTQTPIPGGAHILSEGLGISPGGEPDRWFCGFDTDAGGATTQAFRWNSQHAAMTLLGRLPGDTQSQAIDINNAGIAVGVSAGAVEQAVVWDADGHIALLQDLLVAAGVNTSAWTRLTRATTLTDDGLTIGGSGVWAADGTTRGFIATIPEPATLLLVLGGLALVRRRQDCL